MTTINTRHLTPLRQWIEDETCPVCQKPIALQEWVCEFFTGQASQHLRISSRDARRALLETRGETVTVVGCIFKALRDFVFGPDPPCGHTREEAYTFSFCIHCLHDHDAQFDDPDEEFRLG